MRPRQKPVVIALGALVLIWALALGGYVLARNSKVTAEQVLAYLESVAWGKLSAADRAKALDELAACVNQLSPEERRKVRLFRQWPGLFEHLTEPEKARFLEATLPSGFKQMIGVFEELPAEKRKRAITDAMKRMNEARARIAAGQMPGDGPEPPLSEELQQKVITTGLKTFYSQSSAQTKAELAPLLEEMQRMMETGGLYRGRR